MLTCKIPQGSEWQQIAKLKNISPLFASSSNAIHVSTPNQVVASTTIYLSSIQLTLESTPRSTQHMTNK